MTNLLEEQLPVIMAEDPNLVRFVRLVDPTASELYDRVGDKESIFHPATAPPPVVRWWCSVLGLPVHDDVQIEVRRAVVSAAAETYPIRGTERSLWMVLAAFSRAPVTIEETGVVFSTPDPRVPPASPATSRSVRRASRRRPRSGSWWARPRRPSPTCGH